MKKKVINNPTNIIINQNQKQSPGILRPPAGFSNQNRLKQIYQAKNLITPAKKNSIIGSNINNNNTHLNQSFSKNKKQLLDSNDKNIIHTQKHSNNNNQNRYYLPLSLNKRTQHLQKLDKSQANALHYLHHKQHKQSHKNANKYKNYLQSTVTNIAQQEKQKQKQKHSFRYNQEAITDRVRQRQVFKGQQINQIISFSKNKNIRQRPKLSSVYQLNNSNTQIVKNSLAPSNNHYRKVSKNINNQSADMFKIKQKKTPHQKRRIHQHVVNSSNIKPSQNQMNIDYLQDAKNKYKNGQLQEALKIFQAGISHGPKHPEMYYYAALIYLNQHNYYEGYQYLKIILKQYPGFKKSVYLFLAIACKNIGSIEFSQNLKNQQKEQLEKQKKNQKDKQKTKVNQLSQLLIKTNKLQEIRLSRTDKNKSKMSKYSQFTVKQKQNLENNEDQQRLITKQRLQEAIDYCDFGLRGNPDYLDLLQYRAKLYQISKKYQQAHEDYQKLLSLKQDQAQIMFKDSQCLKQLGLLATCQSKLNKAIYLDQKQNGNLLIKMIIFRFKINLQNNNLIEAKKDLQKLIHLDNENSQIHLLRGLLYCKEGNKKKAVLCFQESISFATSKKAMISSLIQITRRKIQERDFYSALHHISRSQFLQLKSSFIQLYKKFTEGVIFLMKRKISEGVKNFDLIVQKYSKELDECIYIKNIFYLYRAYGHFMLSQHIKAIQDYSISQKLIIKDKNTYYNQLIAKGIVEVSNKQYQNAFEYFNKAQTILTDKIEPFIYRAVTNIQKAKQFPIDQQQQLKRLELTFSGLKQLDIAYQINDSNSNLLFIRNLIYLYLGKVDQGLQDIIKAISKSQENVPKYFFYRAFAHNTLGNKKQAINDFNICINLDQNYKLAYFQRAKLNFYNLSINKGLQDLKKFVMLQEKDEILINDQQNNKSKQIGGYKQKDIKIHQFLLYFTLKMYQQAEQIIQQIKDQQKKNQLKIYLYLKQGKAKQAKQLITGSADKSICDIISNVQLSQEDLQIAIQAQRTAMDKYKNRANVNANTQASSLGLKYFNIIHYYHYLGVLSFRLEQYDEAINNFTLALKQKSLADLQQNTNSGNLGIALDQENQQSNQLFETASTQTQQNCINYNLFLCFLKKGDIKKAYQIFIRDILPAKQSLLKSDQMGQFSHLLFQTMKAMQQQKKSKEQKKQDETLNNNSKIGKIAKQRSQSVPIFTLPLMMTAYSSLTDSVTISLPTFTLITKLSLPVPHPNNLLKPYSLKLNSQFILQCIKMSQVQNRPQPPWVKRTTQGLMFTDDVRQINIEFQTTINDQQQQQNDGDQDEDQDNQEQQGQSNESEEEAVQQQSIDFKKFKDKMKLDDSIQRKLQKIMEKKNKN